MKHLQRLQCGGAAASSSDGHKCFAVLGLSWVFLNFFCKFFFIPSMFSCLLFFQSAFLVHPKVVSTSKKAKTHPGCSLEDMTSLGQERENLKHIFLRKWKAPPVRKGRLKSMSHDPLNPLHVERAGSILNWIWSRGNLLGRRQSILLEIRERALPAGSAFDILTSSWPTCRAFVLLLCEVPLGKST